MTEKLSDGVVRRRAKSGIFFVGSWGAMNLVVGFGGNLVLARLLTPRDFGIVAIGATLMMFTTSIADSGLGSGLIRLERTPERRELKAALAHRRQRYVRALRPSPEQGAGLPGRT